MTRRFRFAAALAALAAPLPATAQQIGADVVVTAKKPPTIAEARRLTTRITDVEQEQVARFDAPVCPIVTGLHSDYARYIADRVREVARAVKIPVAGAGCSPNVSIAFVENGQQALTGLFHQGSRVFDGVDTDERRKLLADAGPVHLFTALELRSRDGNRVQGGTLYVQTASILQLPTRLDIAGVILVIDKPATLGKSLRQIADYAVMRTLVRTRTTGLSPDADTILTLFDPAAAPPPSLSTFDAAYLHELYRGPATRPAIFKLREVARRIAAGVTKDDAARGDDLGH